MDKQTTAIPAGELGMESLASVRLRVVTSISVGLIAGMLIGILVSWRYAPLGAWDIAAVTFLVWLWTALRGRNAEQTARLAMREDPGHAEFDALLLLASIFSLAGVGILLFQTGGGNGMAEILQVSLGIVSIVISWAVIHTVYMLRYARMFYKHKGGINFNNNELPQYSDFAYLAFTIGMTFQISDNSFITKDFRRVALRHALLSFLFGTVILATTINLIAGLRK